jgi:hypothetical protein
MQLTVLELWQSQPGEKLHGFCATHCYQEIGVSSKLIHRTQKMHILTLKGLHILLTKLYRIW